MQAPRDALDENRFAAAEITGESDCRSGGDVPTESFTERSGLFGRVGCRFEREALHCVTALLLLGLPPIEIRAVPSAGGQRYDTRSRLISDGMPAMTSDAR